MVSETTAWIHSEDCRPPGHLLQDTSSTWRPTLAEGGVGALAASGTQKGQGGRSGQESEATALAGGLDLS